MNQISQAIRFLLWPQTGHHPPLASGAGLHSTPSRTAEEDGTGEQQHWTWELSLHCRDNVV